MAKKRFVVRWGGYSLVLFVALQLVPYGRDHRDGLFESEPAWSSPEVRALAERACFDCHSHRTRWPWYAHVAPASWLLQYDVQKGRQAFNFSQWPRSRRHADEAVEEVQEGEMPPPIYTAMHPEAALSTQQRQQLIDGLKRLVREEEKPVPAAAPHID